MDVQSPIKVEGDLFAYLPEEILYHVLHWLDYRAICSLSCVNLMWKVLCYQECWWHNLDFSAYRDSVTMQMVRSAFEFNSNLSYSIPRRFSKITSISFQNCKHLDDDILFAVGTTCKNLQKVDLRGCSWVSVHGLRTLLTSYSSSIQLIDCRNTGLSEPSSLWELSENIHVWQDSFVKCFTLDELDRLGLISIQAQKRKSFFLANGKKRLTIYGGFYEEQTIKFSQDQQNGDNEYTQLSEELGTLPKNCIQAFVDDEVQGGVWELVFVEVSSQILDTYFEMYSET